MKKRYLWILLFPVLLFTSCKDDVEGAGASVLDDDDEILVKADTFDLTSGLVVSSSVISSPDSFLIGEIETDYGTLRADILSQFACPVGFSYPENSEFDSVCLYMYYRGWVGSSTAPLMINAYEADRSTLTYNPVHPYTTDFNLADYCSLNDTTLVLKNERIVVAGEYLDSVYSSSDGKYIPAIRFRLTDEFAKRFTSKRSFTSQEDFNKFFKGLYLTATFGSSTVIDISDLTLAVYYKFKYTKGDHDTTVTDMKGFYANDEVRQVNHFTYSDKDALIKSLEKRGADTSNYVIAPAGVYTRMSLPMKQMKDTIMSKLIYKGYSKRPYVNMAQLRVDVLNVFSGATSSMTRNDWLQPAQYMLLIKESRVNDFFTNKEIPTDTVAILGTLTSGTNSDGNTVYYYTYDLSTLLTNQLRQQSNPDTLNMVLVPVAVETSTSSTTGTSVVVSVKQSQTISATEVRSAKDPRNPMSLKVVYSGFGTFEL